MEQLLQTDISFGKCLHEGAILFHCTNSTIPQCQLLVVLMAHFTYQHDRVLMQVVAFGLTHQLIGRLQLLQGLLLGSHIC